MEKAMQYQYSASVVGGGLGGGLGLAALAASDRFNLWPLPTYASTFAMHLPRFSGIRTFATHQEMFAACPTEVVCVSTYPSSHHDITRDALQLPLKGIVVEKLLGDTARDGQEIVTSIRERNLPVVVPHGLVVLRHTQEILARVQQGEIGQLTLIEIECDKWDIIIAGIHWFHFAIMLVGFMCLPLARPRLAPFATQCRSKRWR
jgi:predicted dehydrogenase